MKSSFHRFLCLVLALLMLAGCGKKGPEPEETTLPAGPTVPADGEPGTVACRGSYTGQPEAEAAVARCGSSRLTGQALQGYYLLVISDFRDQAPQVQPDWSQALDTQLCPLAQGLTWQQYFLARALDTWHGFQALIQASAAAVFPLDPEYGRDQQLHGENLTADMPALKTLYGDDGYRLNSLHQAFLEELPQLLEGSGVLEALGCTQDTILTPAREANLAYAYLTWAREYQLTVQPEAEETGAVTFRHILLQPEEGTTLADCRSQANKLLQQWRSKTPTEAGFANLAYQHSQDPGSRSRGGLYQGIHPGQLMEELDQWLFASERQAGDMVTLETQLGVHLLYFSGRDLKEGSLTPQTQALIQTAREEYPLEADYDAIFLSPEVPQSFPWEALLYPDIGHEHIPEVPLYFQQDFPEAKYGQYSLPVYGCGITCLAMVSSYLTDSYLTPAQLGTLLGRYCTSVGSDTSLYITGGPQVETFLLEQVFRWDYAREALDQGNLVISMQVGGYFTRTGHFILLHSRNGDGTVHVMDPHIPNYGKLPEFADGRFPETAISRNGTMFFVYAPKAVRCAACPRCSRSQDGTMPQGLFRIPYTCPNCREALARREDFTALLEL